MIFSLIFLYWRSDLKSEIMVRSDLITRHIYQIFLFSVFSSVGGKKFPVLVPGALFNSSFLISPHDQALDKFSIYLFPQPLVASCNFFLSSLSISSLYNVHLERSVASHYLYTCHDAVSEPVNPTDRYKKKKGPDKEDHGRSL